jgi:hypothetical protein
MKLLEEIGDETELVVEDNLRRARETARITED